MPHSETSLIIHGRIERIPDAVALHSVAMSYYQAGIQDVIVENVWDTNMGGPITDKPVLNTMQYFYLRGHEFGRACEARKARVPVANIAWNFIIRGDA